jgi:hypothetical protein
MTPRPFGDRPIADWLAAFFQSKLCSAEDSDTMHLSFILILSQTVAGHDPCVPWHCLLVICQVQNSNLKLLFNGKLKYEVVGFEDNNC